MGYLLLCEPKWLRGDSTMRAVTPHRVPTPNSVAEDGVSTGIAHAACSLHGRARHRRPE
jgi:hypothetical protein